MDGPSACTLVIVKHDQDHSYYKQNFGVNDQTHFAHLAPEITHLNLPSHSFGLISLR